MKRVIDAIAYVLPTLINSMLFLICLGLFILVFWYPETAGRIFGSMVKGFWDVFNVSNIMNQ